MKTTLAKYTCADCSHIFEAPMLDENRYGEFLLWSSSGRVAYLNALDDPVYGEVKTLVAEVMGQKDPFQLAEVLQQVFGALACDLDPQGNPYLIDGLPLCPVCRSQHIASWELIEPEKLLEQEIPEVTHQAWARLFSEQKRAAIAAAIHGEM